MSQLKAGLHTEHAALRKIADDAPPGPQRLQQRRGCLLRPLSLDQAQQQKRSSTCFGKHMTSAA